MIAVLTAAKEAPLEMVRELAIEHLDGLQRIVALINRLLYCQRSLGGLSLQNAVQQALLHGALDKLSDAASDAASDSASDAASDSASDAASDAAAAERCSSSADVRHIAQDTVKGARRVIAEQRGHNAQQASAAPASTALALSVMFPPKEAASAATWAKLGPIADRAISVVQYLDHVGMCTGPDSVGENFCKLMTTTIQLLSMVLLGKDYIEAQY